MDKKSGLFVVVEGIDGSGKTTQIELVRDRLEKRGFEIYPTNEPSDLKIGQLCRVYLSDPTSSPYVDALLFAADRIEHYNEEIKPRVDSGQIVISDRYKYSSVIYQGSQGVESSWIKEINSKVPEADLTIYLDVDVDVAWNRISNSKRNNLEKFEDKKKLHGLKKMYQQMDVPNLYNIDGSLSRNEVAEQIVSKILDHLNV